MQKKSTFEKALACFILLAISVTAFSQTTIIPYGHTWKYLDNNTRPSNWNTVAYNDAAWSSGAAELGYGDGPTTTVSYGGDPDNKYITTYFRTVVSIPAPGSYASFTLNVRRDDGIVVYINGTERYRSNMPVGSVTHNTLASGAASDDGSTPQTVSLSTSYFSVGNNTIAVELHQNSDNSTDLTFDLELLANNAPVNVIAYGDTWKYRDNNTRYANWETVAYNDAAWSTGPAELGYADAPATTVSYGSDANNKYMTTYFRKVVNITGLASINNFTLNLIRDDGVVIYVNGVEVIRDNMPAGTIAHSTPASAAIGGSGETTPVTFSLSRCVFLEGNNTIAVEMHQSDGASTDLSFNMELFGTTGSGTPTLSRGPYLQMASETAITFRWRTNVASLGRVRVGTAYGSYAVATASETCPTTEHIVRVTGLTTDTKYFYEIGVTDGTVLQAGTSNFFRTNPDATTTRKIRITAFVDCGRGNAAYQDDNLSNYLSYLTANGIDAPDAWILMGDNAYSTGTDAEYTSNFFGVYGANIMKNHKMYPSPGNHDYANNSANKSSRSMAYHSNFSTPLNAECGGVASGKQNYYSYDIGNIHFLSLDSYGIEGDGTSIQSAGTSSLKTWLTADLAANTKKWTIAYWHHPPYTKSSHNSDTESDLIAIRQNFITFLETRGVDLIICGHAHAYERGYLLKNFTGSWTSFTPATHAVSTSSGRYTSASSCPYVYNSTPANHGTVYVVSGSVGASGGTNSGFGANAMPFAVNDAGIFYFEVEDNRLDAKMLRRDGSVFDQFTIMKDVNKITNYNITNGSSQQLTASWPAASHAWSTGASTRQVSVSPPNNSNTVYTVTDAYGCVTDQFSVTTNGTLPVSLLNYDARFLDGKVYVTWKTATETNNREFIIERSANATSFEGIGTVNGAGNSSFDRDYQFIDPSPLAGVSYYRLVQVDIDGNKQYLGVRRVENMLLKDFDVKTLSGTANRLVLQIQNSLTANFQLNVFDMSGRRVATENFRLQAGTIRKEISLNPGVYIWEIKNEKGDAMLQKVVVQ
jgi:hypothetical protein